MYVSNSYFDMKVLKSREIVIEYEKLQLIQKRATTQVVVCRKCRSESDFVALSDAAELFNTPVETLAAFVSANRCHVETDSDGSVHVCVGSLLARMREKEALIAENNGDASRMIDRR